MAEAGQDSATCPLCKQKITVSIPDKQLERLLKEKLVCCSNKSCGCTWTGKLGQLEDGHLNATPPQGKLMDGCQYVEVLCSQCQRMKVKRHAMENHMQKKCPRRIAVCTYCKEYRAAYEDMSRIHHLVCSYVPQPCPKGCGAKPLRKNIRTHVANSCPKNPQPCPFHIVGCSKKLTGSNMENHLRDRVVLSSHLSATEKTIVALKKEIREKSTQIKSLQEILKGKNVQVRNLMSEIEKKEAELRSKDELISSLKEELAANECRSNTLENEVGHRVEQVETLREERDRLKQVQAQEERDKTAALKEIEKLKKKGDHNEPTLRKLKSENAKLRKRTYSQDAEIDTLAKCLMDIEARAYDKAIHADSLERKVTELQLVIQAQKSDIERLTRTAERRYEKFSKADKREEMMHDVQGVIDGSYTAHEGIVPTRGENRGPPEQPVNPPADESGVLGAALGVAVGVGIAGIAALLRR